MKIQIRRAYDEPARGDGTRVLVDRIWPRGLRKADAGLDDWIKDVAPSTELRKWYGHDPDKFEEFSRRYQEELDSSEGRAAFDRLAEAASGKTLTLVTATQDVEHSQAAVLEDLLQARD